MQETTYITVKRPLSLTILGWIFIASSIFLLIDILSGQKWRTVDFVLSLVIGFGILEGKAWARILFLIYVVFGMARQVNMGFQGASLRPLLIGSIAGFALSALAGFYLFRPLASAYFRENSGKRCKKCGQQLPKPTVYCPNCGAKVGT